MVFASSANNLVTNDNGFLASNIFLRDRQSNTTILVSAAANGPHGGNGDSISACASSNGQFVAFQSQASNLIADDTNGVWDVFVRDVANGITRLASMATNGGSANGVSSDPVMTSDGRFVAFISTAMNLVPDDTNGIADVFVRDMLNQTTTLASVGAVPPSGSTSATTGSLVITPDGRYAAFFSTARGLVPGVTNTSLGEIYVRDLTGGSTIWVSSNATALVRSVMRFNSNPLPGHPAISDDGRFIAFKSGWADVMAAPGGTTPAAVAMRYDAATCETTIVNTNGVPTWSQFDDVFGPEMTPDGRFIALVASNQSPVGVSVQLWDAQTGTNVLVSAALDGSFPTNTVSDSPAVSPDGRFVAFVSNATNLTANAVSNGFHVYLRDMLTSSTQLIDTDTNGVGSFALRAAIPNLSTNGAWVVFSGREGTLVNRDNASPMQVFMRDVTAATSELISARYSDVASQSGNGLSFLSQFSLSDDGRRVVYASAASDLAPNDGNRALDVFLCDVAAGTNLLVSVGVDGNAASGGDSYNPALSRDGRFVMFVSAATNLVADRTNQLANVYLRDLQSGTNALVSVSTNGVSPGNGMSYSPSVSQNGRYVAFSSTAVNLSPGTPSSMTAYLRDMVSGTTLRLTNSVGATLMPSLSSDGRYLAYFGSSAQLWVWDTQLGTRIFTNASAVNAAAISPTGGRLLYTTSTGLFAVDLVTRSNLFSIPTRIPIRNPGAWSADGRSFVFVTGTNALAADGNGTNDVYLCDLDSSSLTLVSIDSNLTAAANGPADLPAISGDGRFVVYRSLATDVVGSMSPVPNLFLFDRFTGSNTLLTAASAVAGLGAWHGKPSLSGDGRLVVFQSLSPSLAPLDLNCASDIFGEALLPWGTVDSDADGLPDLWATHYFGHTTGQLGDLSRPSDDADGDGMTNWEEFLAGTNPLDAASVLRLQIKLLVSASNSVALTWQAVSGKSYRVQFKDSLNDTDWQEAPGANVVGTLGTFTVPADQDVRFYRVTAE